MPPVILQVLHWNFMAIKGDFVVRRLSDYEKSLIERLYKRPSAYERILGMSSLDLNALAELVKCNEPAAIRYIAPLLVAGTRREVLEVARSIHALLLGTTPEDLIWLDESMRNSSTFGWAHFQDWQRLNPRELAKWVGPGELGTLLLRLATFHSNGFVREEAIRRLGLISDGSELPYLLLRLNDWVPQVRKAAQAAVLPRIKIDYAPRFVTNLALLVRLEHMTRTNNSELIAEISRLLTAPECRSHLRACMNNSSKLTGRACFRLLITGGPPDLPDILLQALQTNDPVIRLWAAARLFGESLSERQLQAILPVLSADHFMPIRREAMRAWVRFFPDQARDRLFAALFDPSPSIRDEARLHLRTAGHSNFAEIYREALLITTETGKLIPALSGLAETGNMTDCERVLPYLNHQTPKIRGLSVKCLIRLGGEACFDLVFEKVQDPSPGVSACARKALSPYITGPVAERLWSSYNATSIPHARKNLLLLIAALPKWDSISYLITAASDENESIKKIAKASVERWHARYNRNQVPPSQTQLARLKTAITTVTNTIDESTVRFLRFFLGLS